MKKAVILSLILIFSLLSLPANGQVQNYSETVRGRIIEVNNDSSIEENRKTYESGVQEIKVRIDQGKFKGEIFNTNHALSGNPARDFYYHKGDRVLIWLESQNNSVTRVLIREVIRDHYLGYLAIFFILSLLLVGGIKGLKTIITLGITAFLILKILLPLILQGYPPIPTTIIVASITVTISLIIISGFTRKTLAATIGTIGGVLVAGILAGVMTSLVRLTGLSGDESQMLMYIPQRTNFDFQGLLFAGMIIGSLGAVLDVGMSIASAIDEIKRANPSISTKRLIKAGMNVGRDIMGTMSNTLILAYTGTSMSLLLVITAYDISFARIINMDSMSTEIVRVLAGSIGLIYAIPITAVVSGLLYRDINFKTEDNINESKNIN
ncbi:YibE/F family protein [Halonatronum saccharophilum]|uniref:YibE/F family protein n=1 Tax=Halonatronum saccharophilum TaxID=150060 RepID=UPI000484816C|nr:YibE/F family protein [Halonatronum saccharophilum]